MDRSGPRSSQKRPKNRTGPDFKTLLQSPFKVHDCKAGFGADRHVNKTSGEGGRVHRIRPTVMGHPFEALKPSSMSPDVPRNPFEASDMSSKPFKHLEDLSKPIKDLQHAAVPFWPRPPPLYTVPFSSFLLCSLIVYM